MDAGPFETTKVVSVPTTNDVVFETGENFAGAIALPDGLEIEDGAGVATIVDNDPLPVT